MPAEKYIEWIQNYNEDQKQIKENILYIFATENSGTDLIFRLKWIICDGLLVSPEIVSSIDIYRCLRHAMESKSIYIPPVSHDMNTGSFIGEDNNWRRMDQLRILRQKKHHVAGVS